MVSADICNNALIFDNAEIRSIAVISDAIVCGNSIISERAEITGYAKINEIKDYIVFKNWWSSGRYFTWTKSNNMWKVGCFYGTGQELINKAYKNSEESGREYERIVNYVQDILGEPHLYRTE